MARGLLPGANQQARQPHPVQKSGFSHTIISSSTAGLLRPRMLPRANHRLNISVSLFLRSKKVPTEIAVSYRSHWSWFRHNFLKCLPYCTRNKNHSLAKGCFPIVYLMYFKHILRFISFYCKASNGLRQSKVTMPKRMENYQSSTFALNVTILRIYYHVYILLSDRYVFKP